MVGLRGVKPFSNKVAAQNDGTGRCSDNRRDFARQRRFSGAGISTDRNESRGVVFEQGFCNPEVVPGAALQVFPDVAVRRLAR